VQRVASFSECHVTSRFVPGRRRLRKMELASTMTGFNGTADLWDMPLLNLVLNDRSSRLPTDSLANYRRTQADGGYPKVRWKAEEKFDTVE